MKIRTLKKQLKRANTVKVITLKDKTPTSQFKGMHYQFGYYPDIEELHFNKFGVTLVDVISDRISNSFTYKSVVSIG